MDAASAEKEGQVYEALLDAASTERELRACIVLVFFFLCRSIMLSTHKHWARYLVVVPRPMPAAPLRYLIVVPRRSPAATVCNRYLVVGLRPLPAAPFLVRRRYLIVVPRPLPAAPLAVRRSQLIEMPRSVLAALVVIEERGDA